MRIGFVLLFSNLHLSTGECFKGFEKMQPILFLKLELVFCLGSVTQILERLISRLGLKPQNKSIKTNRCLKSLHLSHVLVSTKMHSTKSNPFSNHS